MASLESNTTSRKKYPVCYLCGESVRHPSSAFLRGETNDTSYWQHLECTDKSLDDTVQYGELKEEPGEPYQPTLPGMEDW